MAIMPISVSTLNEYIDHHLKDDRTLRNVLVKGEITGFSPYGNGNIYFDLTDGICSINCVIWSSVESKIKKLLKDGDEVLAEGRIGFYKERGRIQFSINTIEIAGEGEGALAFERLKEKLNKEGLFDQKYKKPLPEHPGLIGIVTSGSGAAVEDIVKTLKSRTCLTDAIIFPVLVQGSSAAGDMIRMLNFLNDNLSDKLDLIILGRGGGSAEDLSAFNDEGLARAIFNCKIPIISAVGHEVDFSISDFVADARAATPTAAAQMAVQDDKELMRKAKNAADTIAAALSNKLIYDDLYIERMKDQIHSNMLSFLSGQEAEIEKAMLRLKQGDVRGLLKEGYALISDSKGKIIREAALMKKNKDYRITFADGYADVETKDIVTGDNNGKE